MAKNTLKKGQLSQNPLDAAYHLGERHNVSDIARKLGISPVVMANKLNPHQEFHKLSLGEAVAITELTHDNGILEAWAHTRGCMLVPVPQAVCCDEDLCDQLLVLNEAMGNALATIKAARADGVIDPAEFEQIKQRVSALVTESLALQQVVGETVRELHPNKLNGGW